MNMLRRSSITLVTAFITAALLLIPAILLADDGGDRAPQTAAAPAPPTRPAATASDVGPEGVPRVKGQPLGRASSPAPGQSRGGIPCGSTEQLSYHVHARLTISVNGKPRKVPLGVGIAPPVRVTKSREGPFASDGRCFAFVHTHAGDGVIHI